jgi:hypothetical protein
VRHAMATMMNVHRSRAWRDESLRWNSLENSEPRPSDRPNPLHEPWEGEPVCTASETRATEEVETDRARLEDAAELTECEDVILDVLHDLVRHDELREEARRLTALASPVTEQFHRPPRNARISGLGGAPLRKPLANQVDTSSFCRSPRAGFAGAAAAAPEACAVLGSSLGSGVTVKAAGAEALTGYRRRQLCDVAGDGSHGSEAVDVQIIERKLERELLLDAV